MTRSELFKEMSLALEIEEFLTIPGLSLGLPQSMIPKSGNRFSEKIMLQ